MKLTAIPSRRPCPLLPWAAEASTRLQTGKAVTVLEHGRPAAPVSQVHEPQGGSVLLCGA